MLRMAQVHVIRHKVLVEGLSIRLVSLVVQTQVTFQFEVDRAFSKR